MALLSIPLLASALLISYAVYKIYHAFLSPLAKIPNASPISPVTSLWMLWIRFKARENQTIHLAHQRHGPIVRLGPNEISVNCVKGGLQTIYAGGFDKWEFYANLFDNYG